MSVVKFPDAEEFIKAMRIVELWRDHGGPTIRVRSGFIRVLVAQNVVLYIEYRVSVRMEYLNISDYSIQYMYLPFYKPVAASSSM